jgi:amino acid adenylation domain-containing protein
MRSGLSDAADIEYWRARLRGMAAPTPIPVMAIGENGESDRGFIETELPTEISDRLRQICDARGISVATVFQAAWALLLSYYSGDGDVVLGSVQSGRDAGSAEFERMVGPMATVLPLRVTIDPAAIVGDWLAEVARSQVELVEHSLSSLVDIRRCTGVRHDRRLFESIVSVSTSCSSAAATSTTPRIRAAASHVRTEYPLAMSISGNSVHSLRLDYESRRLTRLSAERVLGCYRKIIESIAARSRARVADVEYLRAHDLSLMLSRWNDTDVALPTDRTILDLVLANAAEYSESIALRCGETKVSYGELGSMAGRLAAALRSRGVGAGDLVGVHLDRSIDMVATLLGIAWSGAAYLPLDPAYPAERLSYLVDDSRAALIITSSSVPQIAMRSAETAFIEDLLLGDGTPSDTAAPLRPGPDDQAYTIYTSGSTGRPKGVDITHGALLNHLLAMARRLESRPQDVWLSLASLSFDISALEIFLPLIVGACVVMVSESATYDSSELLSLVRDCAISHIQATPAGWRRLISAGFDEPTLVAVSGGEPLSAQLAHELGARSRRLVNVYGPTETTIWATAADVPASVEVVDVGRPLDNMRTYVLDPGLRPVPIGAVGELHIGGIGVANGYRHRPSLTAQRFRPNPYGPPGARLYGTGDRARLLDDGKIQVLGRIDNQVKIFGHRIEPGEIEACLVGHDQIDQAVVVAREYSGELRLVAYVTTTTDDLPEPAALRRYLLTSLPRYMMPAAFIRLARFPLTPNGKIDRRGLPLPGATTTTPKQGFVSPRNSTEQVLSDIWAEVLDQGVVGVQDNYFRLGGDSLTAVRIVINARRAGLAISPQAVLTHQTVADLASWLDRGKPASQGRTLD